LPPLKNRSYGKVRPSDGGKVRFCGCSRFVRDFTVEVDGQRANCRFDDSWQAELPVKAGSGPDF